MRRLGEWSPADEQLHDDTSLASRLRRLQRTAAGAARELAGRFGTAVLLKGGHCAEAPGTDLFCDAGGTLWRLRTPDVADPASAHGTGCSLSAAAAACLAQGMTPLEALRNAKAYVYGALCGGVRVGSGTFAMWPAERLPLEAVVVENI
jgi:hydroxymethylpyrimidine/phosphomethylpyrimidine kinase